MELRLVEKKDLPQLVELCRLHAAYEKGEFDPRNKLEALSDHLFGPSPSFQCLVAVRENSLLGYAAFTKQFSTWDADFYLYLDCLYLKESARGQGLGTLFMNKVIEFAKKENCDMVRWQTPADNEKAIKFYQKMGGVSKAKERFFMNI
ncbi:GNAT family N-acetyltransferase [Poritiphilus flavus]|uniref:GNAT family N-acetyltransferase n=1 Tax=Poritiphilus flavus TaxID=2697053 RepID=A0A6L9EI17_9FLAO|nr:GNAT family N-acetyltransferase [Poritiphilus flavus]NAS14430.1 GNAT family N-acetyltransferase [Poritiphilus flavus]